MAASDDEPQSSSYPNIIILKQVFRGTPKLREGMTLPYETVARKPIFYELRGVGVPPDDIGRAGDIFWDVTFPYILYFRDETAWKAWNPRASIGSQLLAEHPRFRDRFLWISGSGPSWLAGQSLYTAKIDVRQFHTLGDEFQSELAAILYSLPGFSSLSLGIAENGARHDAEVVRRRSWSIPIGPAPDVATSRPTKRKRVRESESVPDIKTDAEETPHIATLSEDSELDTLQAENSRLRCLLEESEKTHHDLEERLAEAERTIEEMKTLSAQRDEELEALHKFEVTVSGLVGGMDIAGLRGFS